MTDAQRIAELEAEVARLREAAKGSTVVVNTAVQMRKAAEARVADLEKQYEDWRRVDNPPHGVRIAQGAILHFFRDEDGGTYWTGTWADRNAADLWCQIMTPRLNDRARALLNKDNANG